MRGKWRRPFCACAGALKSIIAVRRQGVEALPEEERSREAEEVRERFARRKAKEKTRRQRHGLHAGHSKFDDGQTFTPGRLFNFFLL